MVSEEGHRAGKSGRIPPRTTCQLLSRCVCMHIYIYIQAHLHTLTFPLKNTWFTIYNPWQCEALANITSCLLLTIGCHHLRVPWHHMKLSAPQQSLVGCTLLPWETRGWSSSLAAHSSNPLLHTEQPPALCLRQRLMPKTSPSPILSLCWASEIFSVVSEATRLSRTSLSTCPSEGENFPNSVTAIIQLA